MNVSTPSALRAFLLRTTFALTLVTAALTQNVPATVHHIAIEGDHFALDGKPLEIISGELHYERIPREYWRDRLQKARAMGLNTISTYVFWNVHEPKPGIYDFSGSRDVAAFIRTAQEEGSTSPAAGAVFVRGVGSWGLSRVASRGSKYRAAQRR